MSAEWLMALVLKTSSGKTLEGSNPSLSEDLNVSPAKLGRFFSASHNAEDFIALNENVILRFKI